ncbi:MAG: hypothetical protein IKL89_02750 [Clostridia bacterium]|nr:hypothetical protein [Clostridia bacterium]
MKIEFNGVSERDMDMLFLEEIVSDPDFARIFLSAAGIGQAVVTEAEVSRFSAEWGESDLTIVFITEEKRQALLIEDKIDALAMPAQCERYFRRGENDRRRGMYDSFSVLIVAPEKYLRENEEAKKYPHQVTYEQCAAYFAKRPDMRSRMKYLQIRDAIEKQSHGYQVVENAAVTAFWSKYIDYAEANTPELPLLSKRGPKGSRARWPQFGTSIPKASLYHKTLEGKLDIMLDGQAEIVGEIESVIQNSDLRNDIEGLSAWVTTAGNAAVIRKQVPRMDFAKPFEAYEEEITLCFKAIGEMLMLAKKLYASQDFRKVVGNGKKQERNDGYID